MKESILNRFARNPESRHAYTRHYQTTEFTYTPPARSTWNEAVDLNPKMNIVSRGTFDFSSLEPGSRFTWNKEASAFILPLHPCFQNTM